MKPTRRTFFGVLATGFASIAAGFKTFNLFPPPIKAPAPLKPLSVQWESVPYVGTVNVGTWNISVPRYGLMQTTVYVDGDKQHVVKHYTFLTSQ